MTRLAASASLCSLLFLSIIALAPGLHAQPGRGGAPAPKGGVSGIIAGAESDAETLLEGATVALWRSSDSTLVTGAIARNDGSFTIDGLPPGAYYINVSYLGFATDTRDVAIANSVVDIGRIVLQPSTDETGEVTVDAERNMVEMRSDRTVYNVEGQAVTAGGNALDVLKNVPSVEVDVNDNVSLRGNQNVAVLINNRPVPVSGDMLASLLKGLPSDAIASIEVIPNPSARYDPDGMAGILNINLKKQEAGSEAIGGSINLSVGTPEDAGGNGSFNWRSGRTTLFANYGFNYGRWKGTGDAFRENRLTNPVTLLEQEADNTGLFRHHFLNANLDVGLDDMNMLTFAVIGGLESGMRDQMNTYTDLSAERDTLSNRERASHTLDRSRRIDLAAGYRWIKETARHELSAEARIGGNWSKDDSRFDEELLGREGALSDSTVEIQTNLGDNQYRNASFTLDYVHPLGEMGRVETGYKGELRSLDYSFFSNTFDPVLGDFVPDVDLNNDFVYDEQIHALYAIVARQFGKFELSAGLRAEQAITEFNLTTTDETFDNDYFSLFPSASASYQIDDARQVRANYSKRINRPGWWQLNPFPRYEDRLNLRSGNPYLKPEYSHSLEIGYNQYASWGTISISPYYRYTTDIIQRWFRVDSNNVGTLTFENLATNDSWGANIVSTFRVGERLNGFVSFDIYRMVTDGTNVESSLNSDALSWSGHTNISYNVLKSLIVQAMYRYQAPFDISGGQIGASHWLDLAIRQMLFNDRGSLTLRIGDPFHTQGFSYFRDNEDFYIEGDHKWSTRELVLSFSMSFGQQLRNQNRRQPQGGGQGGGMDVGM